MITTKNSILMHIMNCGILDLNMLNDIKYDLMT